MKLMTIIDILLGVEGPIRPVAEEHIDQPRRRNIERWCEASDCIIDELIKCANTNLRSYASAKSISDYARQHLKELQECLAENIQRWEEEDNA